MKQHLTPHRRAAALLLAAALPATPLFAQDVPTVDAPPVVAAPAPTTPAPTPVMGPSAAVRGPIVTHEAAAAPTAAHAVRAAPRPAPLRTSRAVPTGSPEPSPAPAAAVSAGVAPTVAPAAPVAAAPARAAAPSVPATAAPTPASADARTSWWPFAAGAAILAILIGAIVAVRRRRDEDEIYDDEPAYAEPVFAEAVYEAPATQPVADPLPLPVEMAVAEADAADMEALAATSDPHPDRPWLEFLMRPVRAGADEDAARVEFELTVGNTGDVPARDVRVSAWMVAAGAATDMERSLIEPPAGAAHSELSLAPGDGAKVEAKVALATQGAVLPVVVADARYRLPDGSEGRTAASFAIGRSGREGLEPFTADSGLHDDVEARLHGEPERV